MAPILILIFGVSPTTASSRAAPSPSRSPTTTTPVAMPTRTRRVRSGCGASPATAMSHIAIAEALDGKTVEWMEHVTDVQYRA